MVNEITRNELTELMHADRPFKLVNVLGKEQFDREHITGSISIPLPEIGKGIKGLPDREELIVVYCASFSCRASTRAAELLGTMGFRNVMCYAGGVKDYREAGLPLEGSCHAKAS